MMKYKAWRHPKKKAKVRKVNLDESCGDPAWLAKTQADKLRVQSATRPWLALKELMVTEPHFRGGANVPGFTLPLCITHGEADKAAPVMAAKFLFGKSGTPTESKVLKIIPGGTHNLFADHCREEVMTTWLTFWNDCVAGKFSKVSA